MAVTPGGIITFWDRTRLVSFNVTKVNVEEPPVNNGADN